MARASYTNIALVIASALCYAGALALVPGSGLLALIFLPLVFFVLLRVTLAWWHGVLWGTLLWGIHFIWFLQFCYTEANTIYWWLPYCVMVAYCTVYVPLWFVLARWSVIGATVLYFWFIDSGVFFVFDYWEGYRLSFPINALVILPGYQILLGMFGRWGTVLVWISLSYLLVAPHVGRPFRSGVIVYFLLTMFYRQPHVHWTTETELPTVLVAEQYSLDDPYLQARAIYEELKQKSDTNAQDALFVAPESTFPFPLNHYRWAINLWKSALREEQHFVLGAHWKEGENTANNVFLLTEQLIRERYEKKHLLFFAERIPKISLVNKDFSTLFHKGTTFGPTHCPSADPIVRYRTKRYYVYLCSELFFNTPSIAEVKQTFKPDALLVLVNDRQFYSRSLCRLLRQYAVAACIEHQMSIVYVSCRGTCQIMPRDAQ